VLSGLWLKIKSNLATIEPEEKRLTHLAFLFSVFISTSSLSEKPNTPNKDKIDVNFENEQKI
jgi:hypothetical protein